MQEATFKKCLKTGGRVALLIALIAVPVYAITYTNWVHPCANMGDLVCLYDGGPCNKFCFGDCMCEGSFEDDNHWTFLAPDGNIAIIRHSHASIFREAHIDMAFVDSTVNQLRVITDDTGGNDQLDVKFNNNQTVTVNSQLLIDATNGTATLGVTAGGTIQTQ